MRQHYFWDTRQCNNISGIWGTFRFWPTAIYQDTLEIGVQRTRLQSVRERESKKGGRTYLKDRAGQFTTAKFYCLVKQQFWTPHLYIWRFILNISWSVVHPALNKTCDFRWLRSHSEAHAFETSVGIFRCNPVKSMQQTVLGKGHLNVIIPNDSTDIYIGLYLDSKW